MARERRTREINKLTIPPQETMVENICRIYAQANEFDLKSGLDWYVRTREYIQEQADKFGYPLENAVGAYAVISPSLTKELNDRQLVTAMTVHSLGLSVEDAKIGVYGMPNKRKAMRCLDGDLSAVGGDKVTRFYRNLLGTGDMDVTVDRWALRVGLADPTIQDTQGLTKTQYEQVHDAYVTASEQTGLLPLQVQAVTWEVFRNRYYRKSEDVAYK
jgi:hypothetical protein